MDSRVCEALSFGNKVASSMSICNTYTNVSPEPEKLLSNCFSKVQKVSISTAVDFAQRLNAWVAGKKLQRIEIIPLNVALSQRSQICKKSSVTVNTRNFKQKMR